MNTCARENCENEVRAWNARMCDEHAKMCSVENCPNLGNKGTVLCSKHRQRLDKYGVTTFECTCGTDVSCKEHWGLNAVKTEPRWMRVGEDLVANGYDESKIPPVRLRLYKEYLANKGVVIPEEVGTPNEKPSWMVTERARLGDEEFDWSFDENGNVIEHTPEEIEEHYAQMITAGEPEGDPTTADFWKV